MQSRRQLRTRALRPASRLLLPSTDGPAGSALFRVPATSVHIATVNSEFQCVSTQGKAARTCTSREQVLPANGATTVNLVNAGLIFGCLAACIHHTLCMIVHSVRCIASSTAGSKLCYCIWHMELKQTL